MRYRILEVPKNTEELQALIEDLELQSQELSEKIKEYTVKKGIIEHIRLELLDQIAMPSGALKKAVGD
jgi:hypothetical protein